MLCKVRINLGMVVKLLKIFSKEKSTELRNVFGTPFEKMRSEPFVTDITPVAGMSQAGISCCLPSLHLPCLIILIGRMSLNTFAFGSFLVYQSINFYHTSMTPLFCSAVACRSPAFQRSCWWLCSTSQDNRLKIVTTWQCAVPHKFLWPCHAWRADIAECQTFWRMNSGVLLKESLDLIWTCDKCASLPESRLRVLFRFSVWRHWARHSSIDSFNFTILHLFEESTSCKESNDNTWAGFSIPDGFQIL